jgi:DNA-binding transcriptional ArsR family regulator
VPAWVVEKALRVGSWRATVNAVVNDLAELDRSFTALAHPIRRAIVERLAEGPATVGEATRGANVSKPAISRHLRVLEEAGVIVRTVEGRTHRLRLDPGPLEDATDWMARQRKLWEGKFDAVERYLQARRDPKEER